MFWAKALTEQTNDPELADRFKSIAGSLSDAEDAIVTELIDCQGPSMDIGGYYKPDVALASKAMRPSTTFNSIIDGVNVTQGA